MKDLNGYTVNQLATEVFSDSYFLNEIDHSKNNRYLKALISEEFIYTKEQLDYLERYLNEKGTN